MPRMLLLCLIILSLLIPAPPTTAQTTLEDDLRQAVTQALAPFQIPLRALSFDGQTLQIDLGAAAAPLAGTAEFEDLSRQVDQAVSAVLDRATPSPGQVLIYEWRIDGQLLTPFQPPVVRPEGGPEAINGRRVILSPGHGYYNDNGAWRLQRGWHWGIVEDFTTPLFAALVQQNLLAAQADVRVTRQLNQNAGNHPSGFPWWQMGAREFALAQGAPESVWNTGSTGLNRDIMARPLYANWLQGAAVINIHTNGGGGCGTETWYDTANGYQTESLRLANLIQSRIIERVQAEWDANWCNRGVKGSNGGYAETREFDGPAVIVEIAFHDNERDNAALRNERFRSIAARAISDATIEFFGGVNMATHLTGQFFNGNPAVRIGGLTTMTLNLGTNTVTGTVNFTQRPEDATAVCGAGMFSGTRTGNTFNAAFTSNDSDPGCGFDHGSIFTLAGNVDNDGKHVWGTYTVRNSGGSSITDANGMFEVWTDDVRPARQLYSGTFTNTGAGYGGAVTLDVALGTSTVSGYINFTHDPGPGHLICGAGEVVGQRIGNSILASFVSNDPDPGCGFDQGLRLYLTDVTLAADETVLEGGYGVSNGQAGTFRAVRPSAAPPPRHDDTRLRFAEEHGATTIWLQICGQGEAYRFRSVALPTGQILWDQTFGAVNGCTPEFRAVINAPPNSTFQFISTVMNTPISDGAFLTRRSDACRVDAAGIGRCQSGAIPPPPAQPVTPPPVAPLKPCEVPFFSQVDPRWKGNKLGNCGGGCATIGGCGCALTSAAMVFAFFGVDTDPGRLASCMGGYACPLYWQVGSDRCTGGLVGWVGKVGFSWQRLSDELNVQKRPVIIGMRTARGDTHFVVAVRGQGTNAANYVINDPGVLQGRGALLSAYAHRGWQLQTISIYRGTLPTNCSGPTALPESEPFDPLAMAPSDVFTGSIEVYSMTDTLVTLALPVQSPHGAVTELLISSDTFTNTEWQPYTPYVQLPALNWISVTFRDAAGHTLTLTRGTTLQQPLPAGDTRTFVYLPSVTRPAPEIPCIRSFCLIKR